MNSNWGYCPYTDLGITELFYKIQHFFRSKEQRKLEKKWSNIKFRLPSNFPKHSQIFLNGLLLLKNRDYILTPKTLTFLSKVFPKDILYIHSITPNEKSFIGYDGNFKVLHYTVNNKGYNNSKLLKNGIRNIYIKNEEY